MSRREQERHGAKCRVARGRSDQPMLLSGHFLPLSEHPDEEWNDLWLLTEIEHEGAQPQVLQQYTAHAGYRFDLLNTPVFKSLTGYFAKATAPCVIAYGYARIRRLVRLGPGFYRWSVAENQ